MIDFINPSLDQPYLIIKEKYGQAISKGQKNIEAIPISSYNNSRKEVDSRFVNLKCIENDNFIFFSNYNSSKSIDFASHSQISALIYWPVINLQIRVKAKIKKTSTEYNQKYFAERSPKKNALAISSSQSKPIYSYESVIENYKQSLKSDVLNKCPDFWGGYSFTPYYFEFWEGHNSRLNKRDVYEKNGDNWNHFILQP